MLTTISLATVSLLPSEPVSELTVAIRLAAAVVFGALIGWERGKSDKPADVRTMVLISASAAGFTLLGVQIAASSFTANSGIRLNLDPTRIISYIISGVGFLGGGAILHSKRSVSGLTTAASIWTAAGIGAACGMGAFVIASGLFVVAFSVLWGPRIQKQIANGHSAATATSNEPES